MSNEQWSTWIEWGRYSSYPELVGLDCPVVIQNIDGEVIGSLLKKCLTVRDVEWSEVTAYRHIIPGKCQGISDPGEEEALQEAFERMGRESIAAESKREAAVKWEQDQHNYRQLHSLCIEQAHKLNKLRSQIRRIREITRE